MVVRVERNAIVITTDDVPALLFPLLRAVVVRLAQGLEGASEEAFLGLLTVLDDVIDDGGCGDARQAHRAERVPGQLISPDVTPAPGPVEPAILLSRFASGVLAHQ